MRVRNILGILGKFLQIYAFLILVPIIYSTSVDNSLLFLGASIASLISGTLMKRIKSPESPTVREAITATVLGWFLAVIMGAIPFIYHMTPVNAVFESAAGITTTGISLVLKPSELSQSVLFWRSFMQWIGGLGILTFFIAVIRESGGISRKLFSAEAHKTDPGSIRPSLRKSIIDLWRVYGFVTTVIIGTYIALGMSPFNAILHAFSGLSTGGFSTSSASIGAFSTSIQAATVVFVFIGGMNFVLLYRFLKADFKSVFHNTEFKTYGWIFSIITGVTALSLIDKGIQQAVLDAAFQVSAVISSTGYSTMNITDFGLSMQLVFLALMFIGGSLGSTAGGIKIFRVVTLFKLLKVRLRSYTLPRTAVNKVSIDGEIIKDEVVKTISVLFFVWVSLSFMIALVLVALDGVSFIGGLSAAVSSIGNMGPVYFSGETLVGLSVASKVTLIIGMLAGRLEMLPLLAIFNRKIIKD